MGRLTLVLFSLIIALGAAEALVRVLDLGPEINPVARENYRPSENPVLRYELEPGSPDGRHRINADGMRDRSRAVSKPRGVFRIAALGDSITYGYGSPQDRSYPRLLEDYLKKRTQTHGVSYQVLNFGVPGYDIAQSIENLKARAVAYRPDLVLFQYCLNDPLGSSDALDQQQLPTLGRATRLLRFSRLLTLGLHVLHSRTRGPEAGRDDGPRQQQFEFRGSSYSDYFIQLHDHPPSWGRVEAALDDLAALARKHGFRAAVVVFPVFQDLQAYRLRPVHQKVVGAAQRRSLVTIDLLDLYASGTKHGEQLAVGALHPNAAGNRLAARAIADELMRHRMLAAPR
jgi:lysophospholipase L1-like esterase